MRECRLTASIIWQWRTRAHCRDFGVLCSILSRQMHCTWLRSLTHARTRDGDPLLEAAQADGQAAEHLAAPQQVARQHPSRTNGQHPCHTPRRETLCERGQCFIDNDAVDHCAPRDAGDHQAEHLSAQPEVPVIKSTARQARAEKHWQAPEVFAGSGSHSGRRTPIRTTKGSRFGSAS